jgi:hypothetical protein
MYSELINEQVENVNDLKAALPLCYIQKLLALVEAIANDTPKEHVDYAPLCGISTWLRKMQPLSHFHSNCFYPEKQSLCSLIAVPTLLLANATSLIEQIFDWSMFCRMTLSSLQRCSNSFALPRVFTCWLVDYSSCSGGYSISKRTPRQKCLVLFFIHGCVVLSVEGAKKAKEPATRQFAFVQCAPFTALQQIELLPHADPNVQWGITLKFTPAATASNQEPLLLLLECQLQEVYEQLQSTMKRLLTESKAIQFESTSSIACNGKSEQLAESANDEFTCESTGTNANSINHPQRTFLIHESRTFLLNEKALKLQFDCSLHVFDVGEGHWKSKGPTLISFQANEEHFVFVTFCMHQTFRPIQTPIWLHNIKKIDQFSRFRTLIQTAQGERLLCKFGSSEQIGTFMASLATLRGDNQESCFYSNAVASSAPSLSENWAMSRLKFCAYPVMLLDSRQPENVAKAEGMLTVNEANCMNFESFDGNCKNEIQLDLSLQSKFNAVYVSLRHLCLGEDFVFCFGGPTASEAKVELVRLWNVEVVQQLQSEEKLQQLFIL